ncbi:MAG TPA: hypothetical protein VF680_11555 [Allosphingosinicella sp.]
MTKLRPPVSAENALTRIAGAIEWEGVACIAGLGVRAVRNWSDPDTEPMAGKAISLELALRLDLAYRQAGGQGAPMLHFMATRLELDCLAAAPDAAALAHATAIAVKESGEAHAAAIVASQPNAAHADLIFAERQLEEASAATNTTLHLVRARRGAASAIRAPEVAPPASTGEPPG